MGYPLYVLCASSEMIDFRELARFILEGVYFDQDPYLVPLPEETDGDSKNWSLLSVTYDSDKKPVVFRRYLQHDERFQEVVGGLVFGVTRSIGKTKSRQRVLSHLEETVQLIDIEIIRSEIDDDCWVMLDCVESFVAKKYKGLVFASGDGFFDENLKSVFKL